MEAYHGHLRSRVVRAVMELHYSYRQVAKLFDVSIAFISSVVRLFRERGDVAPRPHRGGMPPVLTPAALDRLRQHLLAHPDSTLSELREACRLACGLSTIARAIKKLGMSRKKLTPRSRPPDAHELMEARVAFAESIQNTPANKLVFVDESGVNTAMTRVYGYSPVGQRAYVTRPGGWTTYTIIGGMRLGEVAAALLFKGSTDSAAFGAFVKNSLAPTLRAGDVVVWDRLTSHECREAFAAVEAQGAIVHVLPPYSPELNPIEHLWSKLKGIFRASAPRSEREIFATAARSFAAVTPNDILGWFGDGMQELLAVLAYKDKAPP